VQGGAVKLEDAEPRAAAIELNDRKPVPRAPATLEVFPAGRYERELRSAQPGPTLRGRVLAR
jgi:hypothetical protein